MAGMNRLTAVELHGASDVTRAELVELEPTIAAHLRTADMQLVTTAHDDWLVHSDRALDVQTATPESAAESVGAGDASRTRCSGVAPAHDGVADALARASGQRDARRGEACRKSTQCGFMAAGEIRDLQRYALPQAFGDDLYLRGIYRLHDAAVTSTPTEARTLLARLQSRAVAVVATDDVDVLEAAWIAPLTRALAIGAHRAAGHRCRSLAHHGRAARNVEVLAQRAAAGAVDRTMNRTIRRRDGSESDGFAGDLHPLLRRLYAARGVRLSSELDLGLNQLIPIGQLDGVSAAVELLCAHFQKGSPIVVIGDFDADGATSTALVVRQLRRLGFASIDFLVPNRFEYGYGLTPEIVRLAAQRQSGSDHHGRQRRVESRRRRRGALARHRHADHRSPSGAADVARGGRARESQRAGQFLSEQGAGRRRRRVLSDGGIDPRDADTRPACRRRAGRGSARPRSARHGRRSRAARSQQPRARAAGAATHSRWPVLRRRARSAGDVEPRARDGARIRSRLSGRAAAECSRPARRHVDRHPVPAHRRHRGGSAAGVAARAAQSGSPRARAADAAGGDAGHRGHARRGSGAAARVVPVRRDLAPGRRRSRGLAREGSRASAGDRAGARGCEHAERLGPLRRRRAHPRRARCCHHAAPGSRREVRRACDGRRSDAARRCARRVPRCVRCGSAPLDDDRGRDRHRALGRPAERSASARSTSRGCCSPAARGVRRFPSRCSTTVSRCAPRASSASGISSWISKTGTAACARRSRSGTSTMPMRPRCSAGSRVELAYRLDVNQYNGLEKVQLVVEYLRVLSG